MSTFSAFTKSLPWAFAGPLQVPVSLGARIFGYKDPTLFGNLYGAGGAIESMFNKYTGAGLTGAEQAQNAFNASEAAKNRQWQEKMSNTAITREVQDMQNAGVNPALMYGNGAAGASTPSGSAASSGSSNNGMNFSELLQAIGLKSQIELTEAQTKKVLAEENKTKTETAGQQLSNDFMAATMDARKESIEANNRLTDARYDDVREGIKKTRQEIDKLVAETDSEYLRQGLIQADKVLKYAQVREINSLLPYKQALMSAQTEHEKAAASLAIAQAAYQNRLIDNGYVDAMFDQLAANAKMASDNAQLLEYKKRLREGTLFKDADTGSKVVDFVLNTDKKVASSMLQGLTLVVDNFPKIF